MKRYQKLVRDKIPEIIAANGETPNVRQLDDEAYLQALVSKLGEEYEEFKNAVWLDELADIQEVVLALADALASRAELEKVRVDKAQKRGTFTKRLFLEDVN